MSIRFLSDENERHLPMHERSMLWACDGDEKIAMFSAHFEGDESKDRNQSVALWKVRMLHGKFDPFIHEHTPDPEGKNHHVEADDDGFTSLVNPEPMTISDARQWVRDNYQTFGKRE